MATANSPINMSSQKEVSLTNQEWQIVLGLILEHQEDCTYVNRKGFLLLEKLSEKIQQQFEKGDGKCHLTRSY